MVDQGATSVRYARVTEGMTAGTVAVDVVGSGERFTRLRVLITAVRLIGEVGR
jgi:hypothetical protein